jgi:hypothetical protein
MARLKSLAGTNNLAYISSPSVSKKIRLFKGRLPLYKSQILDRGRLAN